MFRLATLDAIAGLLSLRNRVGTAPTKDSTSGSIPFRFDTSKNHGRQATHRFPVFMRISVLIDTYNSMPFIEAVLESVLGQTRPADEIIVSDDASTDGIRALLQRRYRDRVILVSAERLPGNTVQARQAASIARAFARSTGDIILLLDGDDLFLPTRIEHYAAEMEADPSIMMVQSPLHHIDGSGQRLPAPAHAFGSADDLLAAVYREHDLDCFYSTSALGFRRALLERVLPLDMSDGIKVWTDNRLCIAALVAGRVVTLPDTTGCWRRHSRSVTASLFKQRAYLARLAWDRVRIFNRYRRGTALKPISVWRSGRFYLRWLRVLWRILGR